MAKINYVEVNCGVYSIEEGKEPVVTDTVRIQISKRVRRSNMFGIKAEEYTIPVEEVGALFGLSDYNPPRRAGEDCTKRIEYVRGVLEPLLDVDVYVEEITKGNKKLITYVEIQ